MEEAGVADCCQAENYTNPRCLSLLIPSVQPCLLHEAVLPLLDWNDASLLNTLSLSESDLKTQMCPG